MSLLNIYTLPITIATLAVAYKYFKFPKQDVQVLRKMLFKGNEPIVLGHRAGQFEAPENTGIAIKIASRNGATAVEIDLEFSKDGVPVIFHDDDVDRVTDGKGKVSDFLFKDLRKLNAAAKFNYTVTKEGKKSIDFEPIPTLMEGVELCKKHNLVIDLDVKSDGIKTCLALKDLLKKYPDAPSFLFVTSFYPNIVYHIRKECPQFFTGLIWRYHYLSRTIAGKPRYPWYITPVLDIADKLSEILVHYWLPDFLGISLVAMHKDHLSPRYVNEWRKRDVEVVSWTVNNPLEKKYFLTRLGVPIVTDSLLNSEDCEDQTN